LTAVGENWTASVSTDNITFYNVTKTVGQPNIIANITISGENVQGKCQIDQGQGQYLYRWFRNNNSLFGGVSSQSLELGTSKVINTIARSNFNVGDIAIFSCGLKNGTYTSEYANSTPETFEFLVSAILIDEKENINFNLDNVTTAKLFLDENNSVYDFKAQDSTTYNTTSAIGSYRFEFGYEDGTIINRYIDLSILNSTYNNFTEEVELRVCVNKKGTTHYEQLLISSLEKEAILKSVYANCYVAADYTRFGYEDANILKAYTIDTQYQLYTFDEGQQVFLIGLDGSISSYVNIDTLEFSQQGYNLDLLDDSMNFERTSDQTVKITYYNQDEVNTGLELEIKRLDTNEVVSTVEDFVSFDNFTVYFDYSTLSGVNDTTLFKATLTKQIASGTETLVKYFNVFAKSGYINSVVALVIALIMTLMGITFTVRQTTFS
jgi:hypothetical protein